jgi:hypothetical protein
MTLKKTIQVHIPIANKLDDEGVRRIAYIAESRFQQFEHQREGAQSLIWLLEEHTGIYIDYQPEAGFLSLTYPDADSRLIPFGKLASRLKKQASEQGKPFWKVVEEAQRQFAERECGDSTT